jgi:hypothetical protein
MNVLDNSCIFVLSHGGYTINNNVINVPHNITLIQYSKPITPLHSTEIWAIYNDSSNCSIADNFYFINKVTGRKYKTNYTPVIIQPNEQTNNMNLTFDTNPIAGLRTGILYPEGPKLPNTTVNTTLNDVLHKLSEKYPKQNVTVIQLSCRSGDYNINNITEITRHFSTLEIEDDYNKVSDINDEPFFDSTKYFITNNKYEADRYSENIRRQYLGKHKRRMKLDNNKRPSKKQRQYGGIHKSKKTKRYTKKKNRKHTIKYNKNKKYNKNYYNSKKYRKNKRKTKRTIKSLK